MEITEAIAALDDLIDGQRDEIGEVLKPVVFCLQRCAALHVAASVLIDDALDGGSRPDYRTDVEDEHVEAMRDLIAGRPLPDDPRYTALRLQVAASIRQIQHCAEGVDGTGTEKWLNRIIGNLNKKIGDRSAMETGTAVHKAILESGPVTWRRVRSGGREEFWSSDGRHMIYDDGDQDDTCRFVLYRADKPELDGDEQFVDSFSTLDEAKAEADKK